MKRGFLFLVFVILLSAAVGSQAQSSPQSSKIAFTSNREGSQQIYVMNVDGSQVTRLTTPPGDNEIPT